MGAKVESMKDKVTGVVNKFFPERGYGFIHRNYEGRLHKFFFHVSNVMTGTPQDGASARFNFSANEKGKYATDVEIDDVPVVAAPSEVR
jgi:cold shock CspA family protein